MTWRRADAPQRKINIDASFSAALLSSLKFGALKTVLLLQDVIIIIIIIIIKAKTVAKLNSTAMDLWRRSARISRKDKIRNTIIKKKMKVIWSLLDDVKTKQLQCYGRVSRMEEGRLPKEIMKWRPPGRRK